MTIGCALVLAAFALLAVAAQAAAPSLKPGVAYSTGAGKHSVTLTFVTSLHTPNRIEEGEAAIGSQYALSGGSISCPKAKKEPGLHGTPFALFGFPGTTLAVKHGAYGFAVSERLPGTTPLGSTAKSFTLRLKITGTVTSASKITGTVTASGGPCKTKKPIPYTAKYDPKLPVAPQ